MRRVPSVLFTVLLLAATSSMLPAQQTAYMLVDPIRGAEPSPHNGEFKLLDFAIGSTNAVSMGSGTLTPGKPAFAPVKVSMRFNGATSVPFYTNAITGGRLPSIEIRLYNSTNRMFYKTVFENVFLTSVSTEGSDEAVQKIEFTYSKVKWFAPPDLAGLNAPVQTACWDVPSNTRC